MGPKYSAQVETGHLVLLRVFLYLMQKATEQEAGDKDYDKVCTCRYIDTKLHTQTVNYVGH